MSVEETSDGAPCLPMTPLLDTGSSPAALWARAAAGDRQAFSEFYLLHKDAVYSHCRLRLSGQQDAEDVTGEVFVLAWQSRATLYFHPEGGILPWLLLTANHLMGRQHRVTVRNVKLGQRLGRLPNQPDFADEIVEADAGRRQLRVALAVLRCLKSAEREIIELAIIQQIPPSTLAKAQGVPAGTVRARLSRALSRARKDYDALAAEGGASRDQESK